MRHRSFCDPAFVALARQAGVAVVYADSEEHPAIADDTVRARLRLDPAEAVFSIERLGTCSGEPVEWRVTTIRGSRFTFVADWTAGQRSELRLQLVGLSGGAARPGGYDPS